jgi:hypothetical protein
LQDTQQSCKTLRFVACSLVVSESFVPLVERLVGKWNSIKGEEKVVKCAVDFFCWRVVFNSIHQLEICHDI